jgi:DNA repair exonuclease SbcCD ATPase subunit
MKTILLKSMSLIYFKGVREFSLDFHPTTTNVFGENATGKTTLFDAFTWLLFGKDSNGKSDSNFDIKTRDKGTDSVIPEVDHIVSAVLIIDGREIELKRVFREKWQRKRGSSISEFVGHETVCYFDGVAKSITDYNKAVAEILSEDLFKLITNPLYFNGLHWEKRRNVLIELAGQVDNRMIAGDDSKFDFLLNLNDNAIKELKQKTAQQKKVINDQLKLIPTRIDEVKRNMPEAQDWAAIEKQIAELQAQVKTIETQISDRGAAMDSEYDKINAIRRQISELQGKQQTAVTNARLAEQQRVANANMSRTQKESDLRIARSTNESLKRQLQQSENDFSISQRISETDKKLADKRAEFTAKNAEEFKPTEFKSESDCLTCPAFGHACADATATSKFNSNKEDAKANHASIQEHNRSQFNTSKIATLDRINEEGGQLGKQLEELKKQAETKKGLEADLRIQIQESDKEVMELETALQNLPVETAREIIQEQLPEWVELGKQITELQSTIVEPEKVDNSELLSRKTEISTQIETLRSQLRFREEIERINTRVSELKAEESRLAQEVADLEKTEFTILDFTKAKMDEVDRRVNGMFSQVRFKLFETQINGAEVETCEALINTNGSWVPYNTGGNTAGKLNAGVDIINAICRKYGVTAPIFIDNRESVNQLIPSASQIINLIVSLDMQLTVK